MIPFGMEYWYIIMPILGILYAFIQMSKNNNQLLSGSKWPIVSLVLTVYVIFYIGNRPLWAYADTVMYVHAFNGFLSGSFEKVSINESEWAWQTIADFCKATTDAHGYLFTIATIYIGSMAAAAWLFMRRHYGMAIAFLFTSFSFFSYGTNGLRQGAGASIVILALAVLAMKNHRNIFLGVLGLLLIDIATSIHASLYLSLLVAAICLWKCDGRLAIKIWIGCVFVSLFIPTNSITILTNLIQDNRITSYQQSAVTLDTFSRTGWRWDFILYSGIAVLFGWYTIVKKGMTDYKYNVLFTFYTLTNAAWVLINPIAYSNRFAYISWSIYPLIMAYPLATFPIFKRQGLATGLILIAWITFTCI